MMFQLMKLRLTLLASLPQLESTGGGSGPNPFEDEDAKDKLQVAWDVFFTEWKGIIAFVAGLGAMTSLLVFIVLMLKLGASGGNIEERPIILKNILIALVIAALLGGSALILALFIQTVTLPG